MRNNDTHGQQITNVLMCGNTMLLDEETLRRVSQYYKLLIAGDLSFDYAPSSRLHLFEESPTGERFSKMCYSFSPDAVWYFSGYADGGQGFKDEMKMIEELMKSCSQIEVTKVIMVSSVEAMNFTMRKQPNTSAERLYASETSLCCFQSEMLMRYLARKYGITIVILHVPYVAKSVNDENFLGKVFSAAENGEKAVIPYGRRQLIDFVSIGNLIELIVSITEEVFEKSVDYTLFSSYEYTYDDLEKELIECSGCTGFEYENRHSYLNAAMLENAEEKLRKNYGFIYTDKVSDMIPELYDKYYRRSENRVTTFDKVKAFLGRKVSEAFKYIELLIFFFLTEYLLQYTADSIYFRYVDLRLFYVVILAITHGMGVGVLAGILECVSLVFAYDDIGIGGTMLFYNMDYWLPFVVYLLAGIVVGYIKNSKDQTIAFTESENEVIKDKYVFLNDVYQQVLDNKSEYKRQILGYQDSFGKIFEAVEQLSGSVLSDIFMNGVGVLERILDNHSIAIYVVDNYQKYARLVACSRQIDSKLVKSINIEDNQVVYNTIMNDETWRNIDMSSDYPMYAYGIKKDNKLQMMIAVCEADSSQMGLYYLNLFSIMCSLIRVSFIRAYEYQVAIEDEKYYPGTDILKTEYFEEILEVQRKMKAAEVASYTLLRLKSTSKTFINDAAIGIIRNNDILGTRSDGAFYLILTQVTQKNLGIVGARLESRGLMYEVVGE